MSNTKLQTLKGFRDFLPEEAKKRRWVIELLSSFLRSYGFEPLETPALEYEEILMGKYGEEGDKLMYRFEDNGQRKIALRYDQTVPLARVVAQYGQKITFPFKRYQVQPVWRAENTQKGRFREFYQFDIDTVGTESALADAEIIAAVETCLKNFGFKNFKILLSSRDLLFRTIKNAGIEENLILTIIRIIDKKKKIGWDKCLEEIKNLGVTENNLEVLDKSLASIKPGDDKNISDIWEICKKLKVENLEWYPYLARGMDYYTGSIFEVEVEGYSGGSIGGGGRYDNLIGIFANRKIPAVGFAFGFDRLMEAMEELKLFPEKIDLTEVLITIFSPELRDKSIELYNNLRTKIGTAAELYLDENVKLEKQLKYADQKGIPYVVIMGPEEIKENKIILKNMETKEQETLTLEELTKKLLL